MARPLILIKVIRGSIPLSIIKLNVSWSSSWSRSCPFTTVTQVQILFRVYFIMLMDYLTIAFVLFLLGVLGIIVNRKNIIILLMSIELMLLSINFLLLTISSFIDDLNGEIFALYILVVAAAESAIGLSILIAYYRVKGSISVRFINLLKG